MPRGARRAAANSASLIGAGSVHQISGGVGAAMDPRRFLKPGDVVRVEIDRLGHIEGTMQAEG